MEYIPFGEVFIDERAATSTWSTPYKFNAKELDEETGLYYYGARYYDPRTSVWISKDPLGEKYPNVGSYVYCFNNPVVYFDPNGKQGIAGPRATYWMDNLSSEQKQEVGKLGLRYATPIEDLYGVFAGKDFDGNNYNRAAAAWSILFIVPELKETEWAKGILKLSKGAFHSASGLVFKLGSRDGNRLSHVFAHCTENLSKKFHGVWTINKEKIVSKLDEAWKYIKENNIKPQVDPKSGNWNFIINANEEVGKEGGKLGSGEKLDHILLSVEPNTSNVITAFPVKKPK